MLDSSVPDDSEFTIGWICSLFKEYIAAREVLDEIYDESTSAPKNNPNRYTRGRIGSHKVVVGCLSAGRYGLVSTSGVAEDMKGRFPCVCLVLVVGIASGAPSAKHDVRLGDVVIGTKVVQYSLGRRAFDTFNFARHASSPPRALLHAVTALKSRLAYGLDLHEKVERVFTRSPTIEATFTRPDAHTDRLYKSQYVHLDGCVCLGDSKHQASQLVQRDPRETTRIEVHHGVVGSASQVIKHAITRDHIAHGLDAICFELNIAGLKDTFGWIPIRGICDYSDSHKNEHWHGYAAAAAAVCAKELLLTISSHNMTNSTAEHQTEKEIPLVHDSFVDLRRAPYGLRIAILNLLTGIYLLLALLGRVTWSLYMWIVLISSHLRSPEAKPSGNEVRPREGSQQHSGDDPIHINLHIEQEPMFSPETESGDEWIETHEQDQPEFAAIQWNSDDGRIALNSTAVLVKPARALMGNESANSIDMHIPNNSGRPSPHRDSSCDPLDTSPDRSRHPSAPEEVSPSSDAPKPPVPPRSKKPRGYVSRRNTQIPVPSSTAKKNKYFSENSDAQAMEHGQTPEDIVSLIKELQGRASV
jgi:nucleoside phosphorylase